MAQENGEMLRGERTRKLNHSEWRNKGIQKEKGGTKVFGVQNIMKMKEEERIGDFSDTDVPVHF